MIQCPANKLPEEIKEKAHKYIEKRKPRFRTFGVIQEDVENAWLNGFAFCMEGTVTVKVKQCATCVYTDSPCIPSDYAKDNEGVCNHYKNVLDAYADLKTDYEVLSCSVGNFGELQNRLEEEQRKNNGLSDNLDKAKELLQKLITNAPDTYSGTNIKLQQKKMFSFQDARNKAERFISEVE